MYIKKSEQHTTLYQTVIDNLMHDIDTGRLKTGDRIPSEAQLMSLYGVSRVTIRRAIADLTAKNILEAKRGKGTFVSQVPMRKAIAEPASFTETCRKNGRTASAKVLQVAIERPSRKVMQLLKLNPDEKVLYIKRVRYADDFPVLIEYNYFKPKYRSLIQYELENQSLDRILHEDFDVGPMGADITIQVTKVTEEEAAELNIRQGDPAILVEELNFEYTTYEVIHWTKQVLASNGVIFQVTTSK